jgi:hypothetical protein
LPKANYVLQMGGSGRTSKRKKVVDEEALVQCRDDPAMRRRWSSAETTADDGDVYHAHYDGGDERGDER